MTETTAITGDLAFYLKRLRLPRVGEHLARVAQRAAEEDWSYEEFLTTLLEAEVFARDQAALPKPRVLELCMIQGPLQWAILAEKPRIEDGWLVLPDRPGLGVELAPDLEERFPYIEGHYAIQVQRSGWTT